MTSRSTLVVLALLGALLLAPGAVHPAGAAVPAWPAWWDDHWHLRVPITVDPSMTNALDPTGKPLDLTGSSTDPLVVVPVDLGSTVAAAGWPSDLGHLTSFTLDPTSVRLVQTTGFASDDVNLAEVPVHFYPTDLTAHATTTYDPSTHPVGTLVFRASGTLKGPRTYEAYFDIKQDPAVPAASTAPSPLPTSASTWLGRGTIITGRTTLPLGSSTARITVTSLHQGTHFRIDRIPAPYQVLPGAICDHTKNDRGLARYQTVTCTTGYATVFRVVSDYPVMVTLHEGSPDGGSGLTYFPTATGGVVGTTFVARAPSDTPSGTSAELVCVDPNGCGSSYEYVEYNASGYLLTGNSVSQSQPMGEFTTVPVTLTPGQTTVVYTGGNAMLQLPGAGVQVASSIYGAPTGTQSVITARNLLQVVSPGPGTVEAYDLATGHQIVAQDHSAYPTTDDLWSMKLSAGADHAYAISTTTPATVLAGDPTDRSITSLGLDESLAQDLTVPFGGSLTIVPIYDATQVTVDRIVEGSPVQVCCGETLGTGAYATVSQSGTYHVQANKPTTLLVTQPSGRNPVTALLGGQPGELQGTAGPAQFWGYAGQLSLRAGADSVRNVRPGDNVVFNLTVTNLGRNHDGGSLTDGFALATQVAEPKDRANWTVQSSTLHAGGLSTGRSANFTVLVHVPANAKKGTIVDVNVTATSDGNPNIVAQRTLRLVVTEYHDFTLSLLDGSTSASRIAQGNPPYNFTVLVHNLGTSNDTIDLQRILTPSPVGWNVGLVFPNGTDASRVPLPPNGTARLTLSIAPHGTPDQPWVAVRVLGASQDEPSLKHDVEATLVLHVNLGMRILVHPADRVVEPGSNVTFNVTVVNTGDAGTVVLQRQGPVPPGFTATLRDAQGAIINGSVSLDLTANGTSHDRSNLTLTVAAAPNLLGGDSFETILLGHVETSIPGVDASDFVVLKATVATLHNVTIPPEPVSLRPHTPHPLGLLLTNHGNAEVSFTLRTRSLPPGWNLTLPTGSIRLAMGAAARANLVVTPPVGAPPGAANVTLEAAYDDGAIQLLPLPLQVLPTTAFSATVVGPAPAMAPGSNLTVPLRVTNVGNTRDPVVLQLATPSGVTGSVSPVALQLAPGSTTTVSLKLQADTARAPGNLTLGLQDAAGDGLANVTLRVGHLDLAVGGVTLEGNLQGGQTVTFVAKIQNLGTVLARDVNVSLVRGDHVVDHRTIDRLPAGASAVAALQWTVQGSGSDLRVVVSSPTSGVDAHPANDVVQALQVSHTGVPAPGAGLTAVAGLAAALLLTRRWRP